MLCHQMELVYRRPAQADPEGTRTLHEKVAQVPVVSTPATSPSLSQPAPVASWPSSYDQLTVEKKIQAWFTDSPANIQAPSKSRQLQHYNPFLGLF